MANLFETRRKTYMEERSASEGKLLVGARAKRVDFQLQGQAELQQQGQDGRRVNCGPDKWALARWEADPFRNTAYQFAAKEESGMMMKLRAEADAKQRRGGQRFKTTDTVKNVDMIKVKQASDVARQCAAHAAKRAKLLGLEDVRLRRANVKLLAAFGPFAATHVEEILRLLTDCDAEVRKSACEALAELGGTAATRAEHMLARTDFVRPEDRQMATKFINKGIALGNRELSPRQRAYGAAGAGKQLRSSASGPALSNNSQHVSEDRLQRIQKRLECDDIYARHSALVDLQVYMKTVPAPPWQASTAVAHMLDDRSPQVAATAARMLRDLGESAAGCLAQFLETSRNTEVRKAAVMGFRDMGGAVDLFKHVLVRMMRDKDVEVRVATAAALGFLTPLPRPIANELSRALQDKDPRVRSCVQSVLDRNLVTREGGGNGRGSYREQAREDLKTDPKGVKWFAAAGKLKEAIQGRIGYA